jgi:hypothetical protein
MRALLLRRTAFLATLVTGLALVGSAVHGVSGMDRELELAAVSRDHPTFVDDHRRGECDGWQKPDTRV